MIRLLAIACFTLLSCGVCFGQCPTLSIVGPDGLTSPGDPMTFRLEPARSDLKYSWAVSVGTISKGQGTPVIVVATDSSMSGSNVTATVDIQGLRPDCVKRASESAPIEQVIVCGLVMDEWEVLKPNDVRGRLDAFLAELANNPLNTGIVVLHVTDKERFDSGNKRLQLVVKHAKFRGFDLNRIWFVLERNEYSKTKVYRVPPGAAMMPCDGPCITIKGGDL
jgi:hypothetical protein